MTETKRQVPPLNTNLEEQATGAIYQVIKDFTARLEDELSLKVGDKIEVISDDHEYGDGWYMGKSLTTGEAGLYPKSFTRLVPNLSRPSLLRSRSRRVVSPTTSTQSPISPQVMSAKFKGELSTPASPVNYQSFNDQQTQDTPKRQSLVVTNALSDIDKALEELRTDAIIAGVAKDEGSDISTTSLSPEDVDTWTPEQVTQYFLSLGFDAHSCEQFALHKITGGILIELELAYLKELDISSFGTRFEMFKEIEALKELAGSQQVTSSQAYTLPQSQRSQSAQYNRSVLDPKYGTSSLLDPPEVLRSTTNSSSLEDDFETFTRPLANHQRKKSRSLDDIPEQGKQPIYGNPSGSSIYNSQSKFSAQSRSSNAPHLALPELPPPIKSPIQDQFLSPRRAPNPPPFPSPVQLHPERYSAQNTPTRSSMYEQRGGHSRRPSYDINPQFQFNGKSSASKSRNPSIDFGHSRNGSRQQLKSQSFIDLSNDIDRPASSIYQEAGTHSRRSSFLGHSRRASDVSFLKPSAKDENKHHRRHSSVFSFMSNSFNVQEPVIPAKPSNNRPVSMIADDDHLDMNEGPTQNRFSFLRRYSDKKPSTASISTLDQNAKRRSVSAKEQPRIDTSNVDKAADSLPSTANNKRSVSEATRNKTLRNISTSTTIKRNNKNETSAFMEGIKTTSPANSIKTSDCHGWMNKKGGLAVGTWKQRYFVLHGTRLSYFATLNDNKERGLIDITSHRVLPAKDDDKLVSLYAVTTGHGKFCFKLVPPAPGSRKGLTFTQPKVHYFAVETKDEMRTWMAALIKATIDKDESVPVLSSCSTPTISLQKAQTLLAQARENAKRREMEYSNESGTNSSLSPADSDSFDSSNPKFPISPNTTVATGDLLQQPSSSQLHTPSIESSNGFSSPYDLANVSITPKNRYSKSSAPSPGEEFKSKPYNAGAIRHPSTRVASSTSMNYYSDANLSVVGAAAQAGLNGPGGKL